MHQTKCYKEHLLHVKKNQEHLFIEKMMSYRGTISFSKLLTKEPAGQDVVSNSQFKEQNVAGNSKFKE